MVAFHGRVSWSRDRSDSVLDLANFQTVKPADSFHRFVKTSWKGPAIRLLERRRTLLDSSSATLLVRAQVK
jgi:hypothetical protein